MRGNLWGDDAPPESWPLDVLVYRSRLIGSDPDLVVWGGGNTSVKTVEPDHLGRRREVLRIKGSGTNLATIDRDGFPGVFREDVLSLIHRDAMSDEEMAAFLTHCMVEPAGRRPSIETLLHAFLPARHVDHVHADTIVALTNTGRGRDVVREALGDVIAFVPYQRPGFTLSKQVRGVVTETSPQAVVLEYHGLLTWGETAEESYRRTIELVERADAYLRKKSRRTYHSVPPVESRSDLTSLLLRLRGRLGHVILHLDTSAESREIVDRPDLPELANAGPATADHVLRIRPWPCVLEGENPADAVTAYEERYRSFFSRHAAPGEKMLDPSPRVFLIRGVGVIAAGRNAEEAKINAEVALHTLRVAEWGKDAFGSYQSLAEEDLFHVDYWPLERYKLTLAPNPKELEGRVVIVTGAASGIGRAVARHLAGLGAALALLDLNAEGLERTASLLREDGNAEPLTVTIDLTQAAAVKEAMRRTIETYGGIDAVVSNAGVPATGSLIDVSPDAWRRALDVNATSHFLVTAEALRAMTTSGMGGSIVYIASKNAFAPGAGFGPYSASKAAQVQLARIAALEGGAAGIRANIVNPDAIFEDSGLWSPKVRAERAASHGVPVGDIERFYAERTLLKRSVTGHDVAEAVAFLISDRSRATTGTVITVDGGVAAAFPR